MDKNIKLGYIVNAIFAVLIIAADICYMTIHCSAYITKTIASVLFVLCGLFNLVYSLKVLKQKHNLWFMILLSTGLVFAMLGDILLIDHFVVGALLFGLGHVFFFLSFCFLVNLKIRDILIGAGIFVAAFLLIQFYKGFEFEGMKALVIVYALIISLMLGKAISNVFDKNNKVINGIIVLGAGLFFFSDLMLLFNVFGGGSKVFDILCLSTYYPGEFVLAFSIFLIAVYFKTADNTKNLKKLK